MLAINTEWSGQRYQPAFNFVWRRLTSTLRKPWAWALVLPMPGWSQRRCFEQDGVKWRFSSGQRRWECAARISPQSIRPLWGTRETQLVRLLFSASSSQIRPKIGHQPDILWSHAPLIIWARALRCWKIIRYKYQSKSLVATITWST